MTLFILSGLLQGCSNKSEIQTWCNIVVILFFLLYHGYIRLVRETLHCPTVDCLRTCLPTCNNLCIFRYVKATSRSNVMLLPKQCSICCSLLQACSLAVIKLIHCSRLLVTSLLQVVKYTLCKLIAKAFYQQAWCKLFQQLK